MDAESSRIWMLGRDVPGMKCIQWHTDEITSFADCDILIVDTTTLDSKTLQYVDMEKAELLFTEIQKRFNTGLEIICIVSETINRANLRVHFDNYFWSPLYCNYSKILQGHTMNICGEDSRFSKYVADIKQFSMAMTVISSPITNITGYATIKPSFYLHDPMMDSFLGSPQYEIIKPKTAILSKSDDVLGGIFQVSHNTGKMIFLPMLDTIDESIIEIFKILGIHTQTPIPPWASNIVMPGMNDITKQIQEIDNEIKTLDDKKNDLDYKLEKLSNYKKLVYSTGQELEDIVKQSLNLIGLAKIRNGDTGKDDLLFDFKHDKKYSLCSVEIKGIRGNLKMKDLRQSDNWVEDHQEYNQTKAKGLVIANIFCHKDLKSRNKIRLSSENLDFAKSRKLCIMTSDILLELCKYVLDGNKLDIKKIENAIANTDGIIDFKSLTQ